MQLFLVVLLNVPLIGIQGVYDCITGMWGAQCTKTCGTCEGGSEFCHVYDGYCVNGCASGYKGIYCKETCEAGNYGHYCRRHCGRCSDERPICDRETGKCAVACQPGFQMPYCTTPCAFNTWGADCSSKCQCPSSSNFSCGCNPETGECLTCQEDNVVYVYPASVPKCLDEYKLFGKTTEYVPPDVLNFPYKRILALGGTVAMFVFGNFIWWWFMVRRPKPKEPPLEIKRSKKPPKKTASKMARYRKYLNDMSKKKPKEPPRKVSWKLTDDAAGK